MIRPVRIGSTPDGRRALLCSSCRAPLLVLRPDQERLRAVIDALPTTCRYGDDRPPDSPVPVFAMDLRIESRMTKVAVTVAKGAERTWNPERVITWHIGHCPGCGRQYKRESDRWIEVMGFLLLPDGAIRTG